MADTQDSDDKLVSSKPDQSNNTNGSTKEDSTENGQISSTSQNGKVSRMNLVGYLMRMKFFKVILIDLNMKQNQLLNMTKKNSLTICL